MCIGSGITKIAFIRCKIPPMPSFLIVQPLALPNFIKPVRTQELKLCSMILSMGGGNMVELFLGTVIYFQSPQQGTLARRCGSRLLWGIFIVWIAPPEEVWAHPLAGLLDALPISGRCTTHGATAQPWRGNMELLGANTMIGIASSMFFRQHLKANGDSPYERQKKQRLEQKKIHGRMG